jgi:hypothetical protein
MVFLPSLVVLDFVQNNKRKKNFKTIKVDQNSSKLDTSQPADARGL